MPRHQQRWTGRAVTAAGEHHEHALRSLAQAAIPGIAISVEVPFCAAKCLCCERPVQIAQPASAIDDYVAGLADELRTLAHFAGGGHEVLQLHLGGGSANELGEAQVSKLLRAVEDRWGLPADAEMSIACDPRRVGALQLGWLAALGFRDAVFGVLDLDTSVQQAIGRMQSPALVDDVCQTARACGFDAIALHLLVGLPRQTEASWHATLQRVVRIAPDRVMFGHYRHRPGQAPVQHAIDVQALPDADRCRRLVALANATLCEAGYRWLGPDEFVLDTDELADAHEQRRLRRNLIAWTATPPGPVLGLGAGARSEIDGNLFVNDARLPVWRAAVAAGQLASADARLAAHKAERCGADLPSACNAVSHWA